MISSFLLVLPLLTCAVAMDSLTVAFQWKLLDFEYPSVESKQRAFAARDFIPENNVPLGLEVYGDRLFLTIPRWKEHGNAASLAYINLTDPSDSPKLRPYPNWEAHNKRGPNAPQVVSPSRARADSCGRLWVLDTGLVNISTSHTKFIVDPRVVVYNLTTDEVIFSYTIPEGQFDKTDSFFANVAVEENDCSNSFAYLADFGAPGLVVYDLAHNRSWLVKHPFFSFGPLAVNMRFSGIQFQWSEGLFGLALSDKDPEGYSTLYFHPLSSFDEFNVSTRVLRNESLATDSSKNYKLFNVLGSRGPKAQSGASFLHQKSKVLFYGLVNLNAVACWRTTLSNYTMESQGRVFMSNETMAFPSDIKVDAGDVLWVLSNKLPRFLHGYLNSTEYNFRILRSSVSDAIRGTTCDSKMKVDPSILKNITDSVNKSEASGSLGVPAFVLLPISIIIVFFRYSI